MRSQRPYLGVGRIFTHWSGNYDSKVEWLLYCACGSYSLDRGSYLIGVLPVLVILVINNIFFFLYLFPSGQFSFTLVASFRVI